MSVPTPKAYKGEAIDFLSDAIGSLLEKELTDSSVSRLIVLKSPPGSGKTLIVAFSIAAAHERVRNRGFVTLWLSPGKGDLHKQTAKSLKNMLANTTLQVQLLETRDDLVANKNPADGSIFVVNWEKLRAQDSEGFSNKMLKAGEKTSFFDLLKSVQESQRDLLVVIDESHTQLDGPQTTKLMEAIQEICPYIQLEASATPTTSLNDELATEGFHFKYAVPFKRVEAEGMVRRSVLLNKDFADIQSSHPDLDLENQALTGAWERVLDLRNRFGSVGSKVKPLLLIQYPDGSGAEARAKVVESFLEKVGLVKDDTYATWLSGDHSDDLESISSSSSKYEALIFKQAIATGWDCPRAQVLVQFREPGSTTFRIQTLGRIMRTPEQMHYDDEVLNVAYVFSDLAGVSVNVTTDTDEFPVQDTPIKRSASYPATGISLTSVFQPRRREFHYPTTESLKESLFSEFGKSVKPVIPNAPVAKVSASVLVDAEMLFKDLASGDERDLDGSTSEGFLGPELVESLYDRYLVQKIGNYKSKSQSRARIKNLIVQWFKSEAPDWELEEIQRFIVEKADVVCEAINAACLQSQIKDDDKAVADARSKRRAQSDWEIRIDDLVASKTYEVLTEPGFLTIPALVAKDRSGPEKKFEKWAGAAKNNGSISWWWKNGERDEKYLGVPYLLLSATDQPEEISYPDYLVMTTNGELLVLEVKDVNDRDGQPKQKSHSIAKSLKSWAEDLNKGRVDDQGMFTFPQIKTGVVVPTEDVNGNVVLKVGDPDNWQEPSTANLALGSGWSTFDF